MPTVTSIEPQRKNQGRFNIYIDGQFAFGADEDLVVSHRLVPGKVIQPRGLDTLLFEAEVGKLMEKMYNLLSFRQRSEKEIRDWLKTLSFKRKIKDKEEISPLVADLLIERLKQKGLINDLQFAKTWVEARRRSKNLGVRALKMELFKKGIGREIVEEVISGQVTGDSEENLAKLALEKKMKSWKNLEPKKIKQKAMEFLMRKGFDWEIVKNAVANVFQKE